MLSMIVTIAVGLVICFLGITNMRGNLSSLHSYHRNRVRDEDKKIFGRLVGMGNIIMGASVAILGVLIYVWEQTQILAYAIAGGVIIAVGMIVGLGISFFAMIKYNKGIF